MTNSKGRNNSYINKIFLQKALISRFYLVLAFLNLKNLFNTLLREFVQILKFKSLSFNFN